MEKKKRLIDADALMESFRKYMMENYDKEKCISAENCEICGGCLWAKITKKAPTVDAVEVVRCADCVLEGTGNCPMVHRDPILGNLYCTFPANGGYCSKGVRRGKDAVD